MLRLVNGRFSTEIHYNSYSPFEMSSLYENHIVKELAEWAPIIQLQMKAQIFIPMKPIQIMRLYICVQDGM